MMQVAQFRIYIVLIDQAGRKEERGPRSETLDQNFQELEPLVMSHHTEGKTMSQRNRSRSPDSAAGDMLLVECASRVVHSLVNRRTTVPDRLHGPSKFDFTNFF